MFRLTHLGGTKFLDLYLWFLNATANTLTNTSSAYSVQAIQAHSSFPIFSLTSRNSKGKCEHVAHFMLQAAPLYVGLEIEAPWGAEDCKAISDKRLSSRA